MEKRKKLLKIELVIRFCAYAAAVYLFLFSRRKETVNAAGMQGDSANAEETANVMTSADNEVTTLPNSVQQKSSAQLSQRKRLSNKKLRLRIGELYADYKKHAAFLEALICTFPSPEAASSSADTSLEYFQKTLEERFQSAVLQRRDEVLLALQHRIARTLAKERRMRIQDFLKGTWKKPCKNEVKVQGPECGEENRTIAAAEDAETLGEEISTLPEQACPEAERLDEAKCAELMVSKSVVALLRSRPFQNPRPEIKRSESVRRYVKRAFNAEVKEILLKQFPFELLDD